VLELLLTGKVIDAQEAFRIGLVNQVINHEHLTEEVKKLAESIAETPPYLEVYSSGCE
jgi:enoyl-CoA hydratase